MTHHTPSRDTAWFKATASGTNGGNCVELRRRAGMIEIRDSKDPSGPVLRIAPGGLAAWLSGATAGEFDHAAD